MNKIKPFSVVTKPAGAICNLDCDYCFYLEKEKLYPNTSSFIMKGDILEKYIKDYIDSQDTSVVNFVWQGGEPALAGIGFYERAVRLQEKYSKGKTISNSFQTNGVLLNEEWCRFFKENNFLIGISIDGPEEYHNKYRPDKGGNGSFAKVMKGLRLLQEYGVEFNTLTCISAANQNHPEEVYKFLKGSGSRFMQFIPVVEREFNNNSDDVYKDDIAGKPVTGFSVNPVKYGEFMKEIFCQWVKKDVGEIFVQLFDVTLESWAGVEQSLCIFKKECGRAPAIKHNGDLYSCDHFVNTNNYLGNIVETNISHLMESHEQKVFGENKYSKLPRYCRACEFRFACNGGCPKNRFGKTPSGERGLNYLCGGYKIFFEYSAPYMRFMVNELKKRRPPANVKNWAADKENGFRNSGVGRNEKCPCGSGEKFKKCCGKNN